MVKSFKLIDNVANGIATIQLYEQIGDSVDEFGNVSYGISGSMFANTIQWLSEQDTVERINVRINSVGGSVLDGYSIVSSILNCNKPVDTYIDGLAASTAGWIAVSGKKCYMADFGTFMMHDPSGGTDKNVTAMVKDTIVTILSNRTGLDSEECSKMMKKETWLTANECKAKGIVDEVYSSGKKVKVQQTESLQNIALIYNKVINKPKMENIKNKLNLGAEATEVDVVNAIDGFNKKITELEAEKLELSNKVTAFEAEKKAKEDAEKLAFENEVKAFVDDAEKSSKIKPEEKASVLANALSSKENFEFVKNMISKISTIETAKVIFDPKNVKTALGIENREGWSYDDWSKKDPNGLLKLKNEAPEAYKMLYKAFYNVEPK